VSRTEANTLLESRSLRNLALLCLLLAAGHLAVAQVETDENTRDRAVKLYDAGRYAEARELLEELDTGGQADGTVLYRLYYCQRVANDPQARRTQERARVQLEKEVATAFNLEAAFYLANAYRNSGRLSDAGRVAAEATRKLEDHQLAEPTTPHEQFRVGKLYADQEKEVQASSWYLRALEGFSRGDTGVAKPYIRWAARYLADGAMARGNYKDAERFQSMVLADGEGSVEDYDALAMLRVRAGRYEQAAEAWRKAERLNPAAGDRPRYCAKLSMMAAELSRLPTQTPDGRAMDQLSKEELEQMLAENAARVREVTAEAKAAESLSPEERKVMETALAGIKPVFVAAALQYALGGHSIREAAFFGGYAPLIFRPAEWQIP